MKRLRIRAFLTLILLAAAVHPAAAQTLTLLRTLKTGHEVTCVAFSPDSKTLISASGNSVVLWDAASGKRKRVLGHDAAVSAAFYCPDGSLIASAKASGDVRLWDAKTARKIALLENAGGSLAFSPDDNTLATVTGGPATETEADTETVQLWNWRTGRLLARLKRSKAAQASAVAYSPARLHTRQMGK